jgi:protein-disulfide isomerase
MMIPYRLFLPLLFALACARGDERANNERERELQELRREVALLEQELKDAQSEIEQLKTAPSDTSAIVFPITAELDESHRDDPFLGQSDAPVIIMAFVDFLSPLYRRFARDTLPLLLRAFIEPGQVKYILRDFPSGDPRPSVSAALFAHCAGEQGHYWKAHDVLIASNQELTPSGFDALARKISDLDRPKFEKCFASKRYERERAADIAEGKRLGVRGVPAFFIGRISEKRQFTGVMIRGAQPLGLFRSELLKFLHE